MSCPIIHRARRKGTTFGFWNPVRPREVTHQTSVWRDKARHNFGHRYAVGQRVCKVRSSVCLVAPKFYWTHGPTSWSTHGSSGAVSRLPKFKRRVRIAGNLFLLGGWFTAVPAGEQDRQNRQASSAWNLGDTHSVTTTSFLVETRQSNETGKNPDTTTSDLLHSRGVPHGQKEKSHGFSRFCQSYPPSSGVSGPSRVSIQVNMPSWRAIISAVPINGACRYQQSKQSTDTPCLGGLAKLTVKEAGTNSGGRPIQCDPGILTVRPP